ncbi:hypothetical protein HMPREF1531_00900 [Propionibacterium sp. oral taxon 192 str. F0372]|uniref:DUF3566 domain-containing protein n=1 Tax=Propionibacterium sp. oral taxon 192 TaxID=671222 RepID=UPI000353BFBE|nr:DUF3566 domain-containing protein [Propionibacterium sp. oral taxon 192]EPH06251.1 hypothetical protein HMPREF1531_00900 [Propionibacterium sp. oral taxon 192 str. F0372]
MTDNRSKKPAVAQDKRPAAASSTVTAESSRDRTGKVRSTSQGNLRPARKARLRIARIDPWSVMKTAMMLSIALGIVTVVAVLVVWSIIEASGAMNLLQETMNAVIGNPDGSGNVEISNYIDRWRVLGYSMVVSVVNVVLMTAISTLMAFLYNLTSSILGGLEITLAED